MTRPAARLRLDRLLANMGYGSRREMQLLATAGRIVLDGAEVQDASRQVDIAPDLPARLRLDGAGLDPLPGMLLMLHKPVGVTCSHREPGPLVYSLLPQRWQRRAPALSTVGRLDKDTSGLLLLTDDGALLHRIISPRSHVAKRYQVTLARPLRGDEASRLSSGKLMLEGEEKPLLPVEMSSPGPLHATVTLHEGRYHQVRRMFAALGNHVASLHRDRVGGLDLPVDLAAGEWRVLDGAEVATIAPGPKLLGAD